MFQKIYLMNIILYTTMQSRKKRGSEGEESMILGIKKGKRKRQ